MLDYKEENYIFAGHNKIYVYGLGDDHLIPKEGGGGQILWVQIIYFHHGLDRKISFRYTKDIIFVFNSNEFLKRRRGAGQDIGLFYLIFDPPKEDIISYLPSP